MSDPAILRYQGANDERAALTDSAERLFAEHQDDERAGAELGFFGIAVAEEDGGSGGSFGDLAVVLEAAGWATAASAIAGAAVAGQLLTGEALADVAAGEVLVALPTGDPGRIECQLGGGSELRGTILALGGATGELLLPLTERNAVVLVPAEHGRVATSPAPAVDPTRPLTRWVLNGVAVDDLPVVPVAGVAPRWRALVGLACALDAAGAARGALAATVAYAKDRQQFGRAIGSFQAYQHRCADALIEVKLAQAIAYEAADEIASGDPRSALAAALVATSGAVAVCGEAVQLHGAIGFTWEGGVHRWLKRAHTAQLMAGGPATQRDLLDAVAAGVRR